MFETSVLVPFVCDVDSKVVMTGDSFVVVALPMYLCTAKGKVSRFLSVHAV